MKNNKRKQKNSNKNKKSKGLISSKQPESKSFLLSGLPKDVSLSEIQAFLPAWVTKKSKQFSIKLDNLRRLQRTSTAHLLFSSPLSKEKYRELCNFFVKQRFREEYIVTIGPLQVNNPSKVGKKQQIKNDSASCARGFWDFMTQKEDVYVCNRHDMSKHFMDFCRSNGDNVINNKENDRQWKAKLSQTVKTMQKMKLMKTTPVSNFIVMAMFANSDNLEFPEQEVLHEKSLQMSKQLEQDKCNKNGVIVSDLPARTMGAIGELEMIQFHLTADPPRRLCSVEISGPNGNMFQLDTFEETTVVDSPTSTIEMSVRPHKLGIIRAKVTFRFEGDNGSSQFDIARVVTMSCGYRKLNDALKPTSPYQRPKRTRQENVHLYDKANIVGPPKEAIEDRTGGGGVSPYLNLAHYPVPSQVMDSIRENSFHHVMDSIGWSISSCHDSVQNYGKYWKHLLFASECQMQKDIRSFDMDDARLSKEERYFVLRVPGLSEGRPSVLRGDIVNVTFHGMLYKGRVVQVRKLEVVMDLHFKFAQNFSCASDRVSIHFTFSRMSLRTSHRVLDDLAESQLGSSILVPTKKHVDQCRKANQTQSSEDVQLSPWANDSLNPEQQAAVQRIANGHLRPMPYIIFGPPGTGKTTTVVEAIYQLGKQGKKILLAAPSNDAADVLAERLALYFSPTKLRRILAYSRNIESLPSSIESYATDSLGPEAQAREILSAQIVVSTINLASRFSYWGIPRAYFDVLCVDEAGHATEPEVVAAAASLMDFCGKQGAVGQLILAGDPKQLGPISNSEICRKYGLTISLMERLSERDVYARQSDGNYPRDLMTKLVRNYRSHPSILKLPNDMFYTDLRSCGDATVTMNMAHWEHLPKTGFPLIFHAIDGENLREGNSPSWFNPTEAQQVVEYVSLLTRETDPPILADDIGIITPYSRQAQKIRLALEIENMPAVKVGSVESFQGQERRVIIVSTVRAERGIVSHDLRHNLGFVANPKRFNVAITRAKALLIVIGCPSVLALDKDNWLPFMRYCHEGGGWSGDSWDPCFADDMIMLSEASVSSDAEEEDLDAPSPAAQEEGFCVIHLQE